MTAQKRTRAAHKAAGAPVDVAGDTYSTTQAAQLLGVSGRRIRQLITEGRIPATKAPDGTQRLDAGAVNAERARRKREGGSTTGRSGGKGAGVGLDVDALGLVVEQAVRSAMEGQRSLLERAESLIAVEHQTAEAERAKRLELEAEVVRLRAQLEQAQQRRSIFRRRPSP